MSEARRLDPGTGERPPGADAGAPPVEPVPWRRLDARMLLIHPVETLIRFLPALLAVFIARAGTDSQHRYELYVLPVIVGLGVLRWATTRYRITAGRIELQRGLLHKQTTHAQLDKVRTVDLTARVYHRMLGLARVEISTGGGRRDRLVLDSLRVHEGRRLRAELLHRVDPAVTGLPAPTGAPVATGSPDAQSPHVPPPDDEQLLRLDPSWVRYAPFTVAGLATAAAAFGFAFQALNQFTDQRNLVETSARWVLGAALWIDAVLVVLVVALLAVGAYVLSFWGFRLTRNRLGSMHTRRGLLTTRETSIDRARVRGVRIDEPLGLRLAGGRRVKVVTTGLLREHGGADWLCPPAPAAVATDLAVEVLGDEDAVRGALRAHGRPALRRRLSRSLVPVTVILVGFVVVRAEAGLHAGWLAVVPLSLVVTVAVALDRYAGLGHLVTGRHLVARSGSLDRRRVALDRDGVIGWTLRQSWFQRRAGVATLVATTAAGASHYDVIDVPAGRAYEVMAEVTPDLLAEFS